jgi:DNA-binding Xre family transcriptional regulator
VGLHWRLWQKVEAGDNNITLGTIARIAEALEVDPRDLLA